MDPSTYLTTKESTSSQRSPNHSDQTGNILNSPHSQKACHGSTIVNLSQLNLSAANRTKQNSDYESKYGKYASPLNICGNIFTFCKACSRKFDSEDEAISHFTDKTHKARVLEYEEKTSKKTQNLMLHPIVKRNTSPIPDPDRRMSDSSSKESRPNSKRSSTDGIKVPGQEILDV